MIKLLARFANLLCLRSQWQVRDDLPIDPEWMPIDLARQCASVSRSD